MKGLKPGMGLKIIIFSGYYYIKILVFTSLKDIFMVAILENKMVSTVRDYSPFYNYVFSVMAEDQLFLYRVQ